MLLLLLLLLSTRLFQHSPVPLLLLPLLCAELGGIELGAVGRTDGNAPALLLALLWRLRLRALLDGNAGRWIAFELLGMSVLPGLVAIINFLVLASASTRLVDRSARGVKVECTRLRRIRAAESHSARGAVLVAYRRVQGPELPDARGDQTTECET